MKLNFKILFRLDLVIPTGITLIGLVLFEIIAINIDFLDPLEMAISDIEFSDLAYRVFEDEEEIPVDTNIVVVNVSELPRKMIARQVEIINQYEPKVIGFDIVFKEKKESYSDSLLEAAFSKVNKLVLVNKLGKSINESPTFDLNVIPFENFNKYAFNGFANLPEGNSYRTIRNFYPILPHEDTIYNAFAVEVVKHYNSQAYNNLMRRNNESEVIKYRGNYNKFYFLDHNDIFDPEVDLSFITNKIVLFGYLGENFFQMEHSLIDKFFTPLNTNYVGRSYPDMFGMVIHANIVSMIINEDYIYDFSVFLNIVFSFFILYINSFLFYYIHKKYFNFYGGVSKLVMVIESVILLFVCLFIFHHFKIQIDVKLSIIGLIFLPDILEAYFRIKYKKKGVNL